mmetsp:Transcript_25967/g.57692  ORF Transcript_25967/g.57692 Transcript_25967/m.57692 type:complete len:142 (+) Transcript_25967:291-716(+)
MGTWLRLKTHIFLNTSIFSLINSQNKVQHSARRSPHKSCNSTPASSTHVAGYNTIISKGKTLAATHCAAISIVFLTDVPVSLDLFPAMTRSAQIPFEVIAVSWWAQSARLPRRDMVFFVMLLEVVITKRLLAHPAVKVSRL